VNQRVPCEFFLFRYVPDPVKGEFTNIGILLREASREKNSIVRFTRDWSRVRCVDASADIGLLEALEDEIKLQLRASAGGPSSILATLEDSLSNSIQITPGHVCLADNVATEIELLMRMYVEPLKMRSERKRTGRAAVLQAMRTQFERAGAWTLMRKRIPASLYTLTGDPLKIDCGYRTNGAVKMLQAVSLEEDVEAAKVLAYSAPQLREGVMRIEGAALELTAVVEPLAAAEDDGSDESTEQYRFAVEAMEREHIRVLTTRDLDRVAATAKRELHI
jgi:hypothetical protein